MEINPLGRRGAAARSRIRPGNDARLLVAMVAMAVAAVAWCCAWGCGGGGPAGPSDLPTIDPTQTADAVPDAPRDTAPDAARPDAIPGADAEPDVPAADALPKDPANPADTPESPDPAFDPADHDAPSHDAPANDTPSHDADHAPTDTGPAAPGLTVLTLNIQTPLLNASDTATRTRMVADLITARQPDLVAFQEVTESALSENRAEQIAEMTGYEHRWKHTHQYQVIDEGIAILSRWPILWSGYVKLPHPELWGLMNRYVLAVRVDAPDGEFQLFCTHLGVLTSSEDGADQVVAALAFIDANPSPMPGFLAGDMNAEPDTLAMRVVRGDASHDGVSGDLDDAWVAANGDAAGFTSTAQDPKRRIDYIYVVPGTQRTARTRSCEVVLTQPDHGTWASDHLGVLCRFTLD
jgi:endonuclease/exonuclease/phosphatase family metal-dependent hydrolase